MSINYTSAGGTYERGVQKQISLISNKFENSNITIILSYKLHEMH